MAEDEQSTPPTEAAVDEPAAPALTALIESRFGGQFLEGHTQHGDETVVMKREGMLELFRFLRDDERCRFNLMIDLTAVDFLPRKPRFEVVYHLKSTTLHHRLRIKIPIEEQSAEVDSIIDLWIAADWYERECWEMYGINFSGHPNLTYLLLYEGFVGHPLRKDYDKLVMQPLVPMRPVRERNDYGEIFQYVEKPASSEVPTGSSASVDIPTDSASEPTAEQEGA